MTAIIQQGKRSFPALSRAVEAVIIIIIMAMGMTEEAMGRTWTTSKTYW